MTAKTASKPKPRTCNVPTPGTGNCQRRPEWRGLCAAHRQTHRGLADPKGPRSD